MSRVSDGGQETPSTHNTDYDQRKPSLDVGKTMGSQAFRGYNNSNSHVVTSKTAVF